MQFPAIPESPDIIWVLRCTACGHMTTWVRPRAEPQPLECLACHARAYVEYESTCYCWQCRPAAFPPIPAEGAEYVAIQVEHCRPVPAWAAQYGGQSADTVRIYLNGENPPRLAMQEACAGVVGWVVALTHDLNERPPDHARHCYRDLGLTCPCGSGQYCQQVLWGNVRLEWLSTAELARLREVGVSA